MQTNFYRPIHFKVQELVPQNIYELKGDDSLMFLDHRMLYTLDCLREVLGAPLIINTWLWGGSSQYRGYRPPKCDVGASLSLHRHGRAFDIVSTKITGQQMRLKILEYNRLFPYITRMEDKVSWLHIDNATIDHNGIYLFKP